VRLRRVASLVLLVSACLAGASSSSSTPTAVDLLNLYGTGQFDAALGALSDKTDFEDLLKQLKRDGPAWIEAQGPAEHDRRQLAAATLALEAARIDEWNEWKWIQGQPLMSIAGSPGAGSYAPLAVLTWKPAPLLIEWGCELLRQHTTPLPIERWWQLAAVAVAQRSEDAQFLIGDPKIGLGAGQNEIGNLKKEIKHLDHVSERCPDEPRFMLAQGIAREWLDDDPLMRGNAMNAFGGVKDHWAVGAEATLRLGAIHFRQKSFDEAIKTFAEADSVTRDRYVVFLSRYFTAQAYERQGKLLEAEVAYRRAASTVPHAQSASLALAGLVFARGQRIEAQQIAAGALTADPMPADPWREYIHADDRFWPYLLNKLRAEILK
jgi:tetratricopeptide (TPR) repeat protein